MTAEAVRPRAGFGARLRRALTVDAATARLMAHNRRTWPRPTRSSRVVLVDAFNVPQTTLTYSYLLNALRRHHSASVSMVSVRRLPWVIPTARAFRSFGVGGFVRPKRSARQRRADRALAVIILGGMQRKDDLLACEIDGIGVGLDVYESFLRRHFAGTIDLADPTLVELLAEGIGHLRFWQRFFATHDVRAAVLSHDAYVESDIICRVAYQRGIPVYNPWIHQLVRLDRPQAGALRFLGYRDWFRQLPEEDRRAGLETAAKRLHDRLGGVVSSVDLPYVEESAYAAPETAAPVLEVNERFKVLVCSHCFYDNPHVYGGLLFPDFYEWIDFLGRFAETTDHDWYVKTHPRPLPGTLEVLGELLARHPRLKLLPPDVSHHQLVREGIGVALTCYGTVGEEYPAMGIPVVNAGYNPRAAYDFNHHPRSLEEYEEILSRLPSLPRPEPGDDLNEFYFMHHVYTVADDVILDSYETFAEGLSPAELESSLVYDHFLDRWTAARHERVVERIDEFVRTGARFFFRYGPVTLADADEPERR